MFHTKDTRTLPSHVCSQCGEWWDAEYQGYDTWLVNAHANDGVLYTKLWAESTKQLVCPLDTTTLHAFLIDDG